MYLTRDYIKLCAINGSDLSEGYSRAESNPVIIINNNNNKIGALHLGLLVQWHASPFSSKDLRPAQSCGRDRL